MQVSSPVISQTEPDTLTLGYPSGTLRKVQPKAGGGTAAGAFDKEDRRLILALRVRGDITLEN